MWREADAPGKQPGFWARHATCNHRVVAHFLKFLPIVSFVHKVTVFVANTAIIFVFTITRIFRKGH